MDKLIYYLDNQGPAIVRSLSSMIGEDVGSDFDVTAGETFTLRLRSLYGSTVLLERAMEADVDADTVSYQPQTGDFDTPGPFRAWITVSFGGGVEQDTEEFELEVWEHAPGEGARVGAVYRAARALEPISWDSLRNYRDYGDAELQRVVELAKLRVLPTVVPVDDEVSLDPRVVDFIAKKVLAENVLYAAISFWMDQVVQRTAQGNTSEVETYPDRIRAAEAAIKRYRDDLERQAGEVSTILGSVTNAYDAPMVDTVGPILTPGLDEYQPMPVSVPYYRPGWPSR